MRLRTLLTDQVAVGISGAVSDLFPIRTPALRPPLKWAGGKRWQVPYLRPLWERNINRRLVEPFCGGLAVTLGLSPQRALLNDINPHVINFYGWLQRGLRTSIVMTNNERRYYAHRERFNQLLTDGKATSQEAAALFYYLNRTGYNGLCRFNRKGGFNVPFGRYARITYTRDFTPYRECLSDWDFVNTLIGIL
jgi:DNA adenine methylase